MEKLKWVYEQRLKDSWDGTNLSFEKDRAYGFSWPQRNYECSFCKKEFKSAQALGGHMNVHRRDRARMRLSPSWDHHHSANPNLNPNPNPSLSSLSCTGKEFLPYKKASLLEEKVEDHDMMRLLRGSDSGKTKNAGSDARVWKGNELVRLDLNLSLVHDAKEDLDLELRLGYSN